MSPSPAADDRMVAPAPALRVLVVDDEPDIRLVVRGLLESIGSVEVIGESPDGTSAVQAARDLRPDAIVLDLRMPGLTGLEVAQRVLEEAPGVAIILLTAFLTEETVDEARRIGVRQCLSKQDIFELPGHLTALAS